jgi:hypothetical protein
MARTWGKRRGDGPLDLKALKDKKTASSRKR